MKQSIVGDPVRALPWLKWGAGQIAGLRRARGDKGRKTIVVDEDILVSISTAGDGEVKVTIVAIDATNFVKFAGNTIAYNLELGGGGDPVEYVNSTNLSETFSYRKDPGRQLKKHNITLSRMALGALDTGAVTVFGRFANDPEVQPPSYVEKGLRCVYPGGFPYTACYSPADPKIEDILEERTAVLGVVSLKDFDQSGDVVYGVFEKATYESMHQDVYVGWSNPTPTPPRHISSPIVVVIDLRDELKFGVANVVQGGGGYALRVTYNGNQYDIPGGVSGNTWISDPGAKVYIPELRSNLSVNTTVPLHLDSTTGNYVGSTSLDWDGSLGMVEWELEEDRELNPDFPGDKLITVKQTSDSWSPVFVAKNQSRCIQPSTSTTVFSTARFTLDIRFLPTGYVLYNPPFYRSGTFFYTHYEDSGIEGRKYSKSYFWGVSWSGAQWEALTTYVHDITRDGTSVSVNNFYMTEWDYVITGTTTFNPIAINWVDGRGVSHNEFEPGSDVSRWVKEVTQDIHAAWPMNSNDELRTTGGHTQTHYMQTEYGDYIPVAAVTWDPTRYHNRWSADHLLGYIIHSSVEGSQTPLSTRGNFFAGGTQCTMPLCTPLELSYTQYSLHVNGAFVFRIHDDEIRDPYYRTFDNPSYYKGDGTQLSTDKGSGRWGYQLIEADEGTYDVHEKIDQNLFYVAWPTPFLCATPLPLGTCAVVWPRSGRAMKACVMVRAFPVAEYLLNDEVEAYRATGVVSTAFKATMQNLEGVVWEGTDKTTTIKQMVIETTARASLLNNYLQGIPTDTPLGEDDKDRVDDLLSGVFRAFCRVVYNDFASRKFIEDTRLESGLNYIYELR